MLSAYVWMTRPRWCACLLCLVVLWTARPRIRCWGPPLFFSPSSPIWKQGGKGLKVQFVKPTFGTIECFSLKSISLWTTKEAFQWRIWSENKKQSNALAATLTRCNMLCARASASSFPKIGLFLFETNQIKMFKDFSGSPPHTPSSPERSWV